MRRVSLWLWKILFLILFPLFLIFNFFSFFFNFSYYFTFIVLNDFCIWLNSLTLQNLLGEIFTTSCVIKDFIDTANYSKKEYYIYVLVPSSAQNRPYHHFIECNSREGIKSFAQMHVPVEWINTSYLFISYWMEERKNSF